MSTSVSAQFPGPGNIGTTPTSSGPSLAQLGGTTAYVPMKHKSYPCGNGNTCGNHFLATTNGNLKIKFKIGMACPAGRKVTHLSYKPQGQNAKTIINGNTNSQSYSKTITMKPFSLQDLEKAGQKALGGAWVLPDLHKNKTKKVKKTLKKSISVWGKCSGWTNKQKKNFPVTVTTTFEDKDF
ncbi:MAG: hypothetical protein QNJ63_26890 [Calothrix sp. MO_192.B10]|nr:hypothetical protein [Calothrix sp. MO_192.B10]